MNLKHHPLVVAAREGDLDAVMDNIRNIDTAIQNGSQDDILKAAIIEAKDGDVTAAILNRKAVRNNRLYYLISAINTALEERLEFELADGTTVTAANLTIGKLRSLLGKNSEFGENTQLQKYTAEGKFKNGINAALASGEHLTEEMLETIVQSGVDLYSQCEGLNAVLASGEHLTPRKLQLITELPFVSGKEKSHVEIIKDGLTDLLGSDEHLTREKLKLVMECQGIGEYMRDGKENWVSGTSFGLDEGLKKAFSGEHLTPEKLTLLVYSPAARARISNEAEELIEGLNTAFENAKDAETLALLLYDNISGASYDGGIDNLIKNQTLKTGIIKAFGNAFRANDYERIGVLARNEGATGIIRVGMNWAKEDADMREGTQAQAPEQSDAVRKAMKLLIG